MGGGNLVKTGSRIQDSGVSEALVLGAGYWSLAKILEDLVPVGCPEDNMEPGALGTRHSLLAKFRWR